MFFVLNCVLMCHVLMQMLSRSRLVNSTVRGWVLFLVQLCLVLLAFDSHHLFFIWLVTRFLQQRLFLKVCLQRVQLKVCSVR